MTDTRLDIRLDRGHRQRLEAIAALRGRPLSAVVRDLIDKEYQELRYAEKLRAVQRLATANIEAAPDPDVLAKQLEETYALPDLP